MQIFVETNAGKQISVRMTDASDTVADVKTAVQEKEEIDAEQLRLIFAGQLLENERALSSYSIFEGSSLQLGENSITFKKLSRWVRSK